MDPYRTDPYAKSATENPLSKAVPITTEGITFYEPSAPPLQPQPVYPSVIQASDIRVVEPFLIAPDESTPLNYASNEHSHHTDLKNPNWTGRLESRAIDQQIVRGHYDGIKIRQEEAKKGKQAESIALSHSNQLDKVILKGSKQDIVTNDLEIKSIPQYVNYDITQLTDHRYDATKDIIHKGHNDPKHGIYGTSGYEVKEYKSIYDQPNNNSNAGEYKMSEYKSIYD